MDHDYQPAGYCPKCNYATDVGTCPECGHQIHPNKLLKRPSTFFSRSWKKLAVAVVVGAVYSGFHFGLIKPIRWIPTPLLITAHEGFDSLRAIAELKRRAQTNSLTPDQASRLMRDYLSDTMYIYPNGHLCPRMNRSGNLPRMFGFYYVFKTIDEVRIDGAPIELAWPDESRDNSVCPDALRERTTGEDLAVECLEVDFGPGDHCDCFTYGHDEAPPMHPFSSRLPPPRTYHIEGITRGPHSITVIVKTRLFAIDRSQPAVATWSTVHKGSAIFEPVSCLACIQCNNTDGRHNDQIEETQAAKLQVSERPD